ncbi:MAG: diaminopimelate decarboxylase [Pseudomonadota bacterium]
MSHWGQRLSAEDISQRTTRLIKEGYLSQERSIFVHDLDLMANRISMLKQAFPANALHAIAVKANPLVKVLKEIVSAGAGLECASVEEVELSLAAGCPPEKIVFDSPAKTIEEIQFALNKGIHINLDNFDELERVSALHSGDMRGHVGFRVNPQIGGGKIAITSVATQLSKFGVPLQANEAALLQAYSKYPWLDGLHVHVGSQGYELSQLIEAVARVEVFRQKLHKQTGRNITQLDIGGGLSAAYCGSDCPPSIEEYARRLKQRVPDIFNKQTRILTEFGRSVQASCGWAVSRVEYIKCAANSTMAILHLGADAFMRTVYHPNDWHHDFLVLTAEGEIKSGAERPVTLVGPLCFAGDILAREILLPEITNTDLIVVRDCGAYTLSTWSRHCNRGLPNVVGWMNNQACVLKRAERPQDVVEFWS